MSKITLYRKSNLMLMARKFKIYIDTDLCKTIGDGEEVEIEIQDNSKELTVKIMSYVSKPIILNSHSSKKYIIKQNLFSTITTYLMILFTASFFVSKFVMNYEQPIFLMCTAPFFLVSIYYSTIGRDRVVILEEMFEEN